MHVRVSTDFGNSNAIAGYEAVASSVLKVVDQLVPGTPPFGEREIHIFRGSPRTLWDQDDHKSTKYRINLNSNAGQWQQVAYQLSHEFGHVKMGPARSNLLLEVFANAISIETILRLERAWKISPPFDWDGWSQYASELPNYRKENLSHHFHQLPREFGSLYLENVSDKTSFLTSLIPNVAVLPVQDQISRAWQTVAADLLIDEVFRDHDERWQAILGLAQHTDPSPRAVITYLEGLPLLSSAIPTWVPEWLKLVASGNF